MVYLGHETRAGTIVSIVLSLISMGSLSVCLCKYIHIETFTIGLIAYQHVE
jgi:hypothetical protein